MDKKSSEYKLIRMADTGFLFCIIFEVVGIMTVMFLGTLGAQMVIYFMTMLFAVFMARKRREEFTIPFEKPKAGTLLQSIGISVCGIPIALMLSALASLLSSAGADSSKDKKTAKSYLTTSYFRSSGGTNMYTAINSAFSLFETTDDNILKMMVVLSDGDASDTSKHSDVIRTANNNGVKMYTVGLGRSSSSYFTQYLKPLANNTGGVFYLASDSSKLEDIYKDINKKIDIETDSDNDGIADYYEDNEKVTELLSSAQSKEDVIEILSDIAEQLQKGTFN